MCIEVYTDGSCPKPHGPGGWAYVVLNKINQQTIIKYGSENNTTNQRMEMTAAIQCLKDILNIQSKTNININIDLYSDSEYVVKGCNDWCHKWIKNKWKNSSNKTISNLDLWKELYDLSFNKKIKINYKWIKGHSGNKYNDLADEYAGKGTKHALLN